LCQDPACIHDFEQLLLCLLYSCVIQKAKDPTLALQSASCLRYHWSRERNNRVLRHRAGSLNFGFWYFRGMQSSLSSKMARIRSSVGAPPPPVRLVALDASRFIFAFDARAFSQGGFGHSEVGFLRPQALGAVRPRASSSARRRSRRRTAGGGTGRRHRAARSALCHRTRARGSIVQRNRATRGQAARRHPGAVAARRRSRIMARSKMARHPPPGIAQALDASAPCPARIPIRTPAGVAPDRALRGAGPGGRRRTTGSALWPPNPGDFGHPAVYPSPQPRHWPAGPPLRSRRRPGEVAAPTFPGSRGLEA